MQLYRFGQDCVSAETILFEVVIHPACLKAASFAPADRSGLLNMRLSLDVEV
jgi:hypothetical protein